MSEIDDVLAVLEATGGRGVALATIVGVRGSTYRREGARLLIPAEGDPVGNISGGCLEGDVAEAARDVMASGRSRLLHFDLTADDEAVWGWGLGCNGTIDVLVEPGEAAARHAGPLRAARAAESRLALVTVVDGPGTGARLLVRPDGTTDGTLGDPTLDSQGAAEAGLALAAERCQTVTLADGARAFVEVVAPPPHLIVCGAGHDAAPLVAAGARLGWHVDVVDDRPPMLTTDRFPGAHRLVHSQPADAAAATGAGAGSHVVVMSHNFLRDLAYLRSFLTLDPAVDYLGLLGPGARRLRLLDALAADGVVPTAAALARLHGPAGLDVGAEEPEEIAWSIVCEILAARRGASGGFLRDRPGPIHARAAS